MADLNIGEDLAQRRSFIRKEMKRTNKIMEKVIGKYYNVIYHWLSGATRV